MLSMYPQDFRAALVRLSFLYTVTASFPLILFPLRTALHSLLFDEVSVQSLSIYKPKKCSIPAY